MRQITLEEIDFSLIVEQDFIGVRGNAIASGDEQFDKQYEDGILDRLDSGDEWAWAMVEIRGTWNGISASDYLGGCTYDDEQDFIENSGYYDDMREAVRAEIQKQVEAIAANIAEWEGMQQ